MGGLPERDNESTQVDSVCNQRGDYAELLHLIIYIRTLYRTVPYH